MYEGGRYDLLVLPETMSQVPGMCGIPSSKIAGGTPPDTTRYQSGRTMGDPPTHPGRTSNVSCFIPMGDGTSGMPGGWLSRMGGDPDGAEGALLELPHDIHFVHCVVGQPPPPSLLLM